MIIPQIKWLHINSKTITLKRLILIFLVFLNVNFCLSQQEIIGVKTVVIDPGHGGKDPGAIGATGVYEKRVALDVSLKVGAKIKAQFPDVTIIYTRDNDKFVSLYDRAKLANQKKADLFISIHANAANNKAAYGSETWVLGLHKSAAALEVAKRENASILMEDNYETKYEDFNPNNPDDYIGLSLRQSAFLDQSLALAAGIQDEFKNSIKRYNRGVKQAGFLVLYKTTMPAVLAELGFLSNKTEEQYLNSAKGKEELANSIFDAFSLYKKNIETINASFQDDNSTSDRTNTDETKQGNPVSDNSGKDDSKASDALTYRVQFKMTSKKLSLTPANFSGLNELFVYESGGFYKYTSGEFDTFDQANAHKNKVRVAGYESAFVVKFKGDKRIK